MNRPSQAPTMRASDWRQAEPVAAPPPVPVGMCQRCRDAKSEIGRAVCAGCLEAIMRPMRPRATKDAGLPLTGGAVPAQKYIGKGGWR